MCSALDIMSRNAKKVYKPTGKPSFTREEVKTLVQEYKVRWHNTNGLYLQSTEWNKVVEKVNKVSKTTRTVDDVRHKYSDYRFTVMKKRRSKIEYGKKKPGNKSMCSFSMYYN